jgi:hypothetical protein
MFNFTYKLTVADLFLLSLRWNFFYTVEMHSEAV